jgi:hypothetical protein
MILSEMTPFEYVIVLVSIILGLGITTILTGVAEFIKHPPARNLYPPYIIWIILVFMLHIHEWWESYQLKSIEEWRLPMFVFIILYPIALYILAHLLFPADLRRGLITKSFYLNNYPRLFIFAIIMDVLGVIHNVVILKISLTDQIFQLALLVFLSVMLFTKSKNSVAHHIIAILLLLMTVAGLALDRVSLLNR